MRFLEKSNTEESKTSTQDKIIIVVLILSIVIILIASPHFPDTRPGGIRRELARQGHVVENVDFEFVRNGEGFNGWIFQSSAPISVNGHYISQWSVIRHSWGGGPMHTRYFVRPYPLPVSVTISFSAEEFARISEYAGEQQIEGYLRQVILGG